MLKSTLFYLPAILLFALQATAAQPCESLTTLNLPNTTITLAQTVAPGAFTVPVAPGRGGRGGRGGNAYANLPSFCRVAATLKPSSDSDIKIEVWMPATGWNNIVFPNVGMPHVLWQLSGINKLVATEYEDHEKATAAAIAIKGLSAVEPLQGHKYAVLQSVPDVPGSMTRVQYEAFVADLVNYMDYMAEPVKNRRIHLGILVLLFLGVLFVFAYALKREYWKDLH